MQPQRSQVIVTFNDRRPVDLDRVRGLLGKTVDVKAVDMPHRAWSESEEDSFLAQAAGARSIILRPGYLTRRLLTRLPALETISIHGTGLNQVDVEACNELGILITNAPGGNAGAVAEHVFGMLLALLRRIVRADRLVREGRWAEAVHTGNELSGKVLGIVGFGHVGMRVARIAQGFGMTALAFDPAVAAQRLHEAQVKPVSLDALMAEADVITLHVPLLEQTRNLIDARRLSLMKPSAVLVNAARGGLVDENALVTLLKEERIAGAALDVFAEEPLPAGHEFTRLDNVVLTPHSAAQTHEVTLPIVKMICDDINLVYAGHAPRRFANPEVARSRARFAGKA